MWDKVKGVALKGGRGREDIEVAQTASPDERASYCYTRARSNPCNKEGIVCRYASYGHLIRFQGEREKTIPARRLREVVIALGEDDLS